ncbi:uncharacterized protein LOC114524875 [Dendronephthya gigantea]|uniref:uncharacterized protein LOC114524875 n=1 Tax=Dendronephthya gigantea TaxID=151771 RepID=UPI00106CA7D9|nr:uncharacterized protein LOC114524875 [Dendronephthya gigantea]XP_028401884.1 uncharacterized protein LOC114524875 [Dendronephthya gigantea]
MPSMDTTCEMTSFTPDYKGRTTNHTSSTASTMYTTAAGTRNDTTSTRNVTVNGTNNAASTRNDEYSSKLIVGSVIGVGMAVVLIIILVKTFGGNNDPPPNKPDTYYISHYPEGDNFVKELKKFVKWLDENGFNVQMLTDEEDLLSAENKCLRRELMSFRFREHMIRTSDKVFVILSPLYIRLCEMREDDVLNENLTEEEKMVKREIAQIRCELNETIFRTDRFIPIRFRLGEMASIPFWIKDFELFSWPEEKTTTRLLNKLNGLPEYHLSVSQN